MDLNKFQLILSKKRIIYLAGQSINKIFLTFFTWKKYIVSYQFLFLSQNNYIQTLPGKQWNKYFLRTLPDNISLAHNISQFFSHNKHVTTLRGHQLKKTFLTAWTVSIHLLITFLSDSHTTNLTWNYQDKNYSNQSVPKLSDYIILACTKSEWFTHNNRKTNISYLQYLNYILGHKISVLI